MTYQIVHPTRREVSIAAVCFIVVLGGTFFAASVTSNREIFQLSPPCARVKTDGGGIENKCPAGVPNPDVKPEQRLDLHRTFFTAWATLILVIPALCLFWFRHSSPTAAKYWLSFWTASFIAFLVHFYWAVFVLFADDKARLFDKDANGGRVSAPYPDTIVMILWGIDVLLAWFTTAENKFIRYPRVLIHLAVFVLFVAGAAKEGEIDLSRWLGYLIAAAVAVSLIIRLAGWLNNRRKTVSAAA